jgi:dipeptidyl aminopeptidase/acylaminoacyl peptidase
VNGRGERLPCGSWPSAITADLIARGEVTLSELRLAGGATYWVEGRPRDAGRRVIVRADAFSDPVDLTAGEFNVRTKVHEYGGGSYFLDGDAVVFSNFSDQRLFRQDGLGSRAVPITPETGGRVRYADGRMVPSSRLAVCVRERHDGDGVTNELVALPVDGSSEPWTIAAGRDFYAFPRPSPDGRRLAWTCWDHPLMPWDGQELWVAALDDRARASEPRLVAGGPGESVQQPAWSASGALHLVSDRTGWWNLYREGGDDGIMPLAPMHAEFGGPQWQFGLSSYGFLEDGRIACAYTREGACRFALLDPGSGELLELDLPYTAAPRDRPDVVAEGTQISLIAGGPRTPASVVALDVSSRSVDVLREAAHAEVGAALLSAPRHVAIPCEDGETTFAFVYPPVNDEIRPLDGERPPVLVNAHGGPTGAAAAELDLEIQFFTSRGFLVVDVNYGGSTGYGRSYRERLRERWGVVDVLDCVAAARHAVEAEGGDGERVAIRGASAGGYTTLCALTFHGDAFAAGASAFGIADLETFVRDTHKFESRYVEGLVGPYPEQADRYRARSPVRFADLLRRPVLLLQGLEDEIVPPSQAETMVAALDANRLAYAYLSFEGEQHGFRRAENIRRALEAELLFYAEAFGFEPADQLEPLEIHHALRSERGRGGAG